MGIIAGVWRWRPDLVCDHMETRPRARNAYGNPIPHFGPLTRVWPIDLVRGESSSVARRRCTYHIVEHDLAVGVPRHANQDTRVRHIYIRVRQVRD